MELIGVTVYTGQWRDPLALLVEHPNAAAYSYGHTANLRYAKRRFLMRVRELQRQDLAQRGYEERMKAAGY